MIGLAVGAALALIAPLQGGQVPQEHNGRAQLSGVAHSVPAPTDSGAVAVRATKPPVIDGIDDDAVWRDAPPITAFRQWQPTEGGEARFRTEAKVAYDAANLYVFVRAFDPHPDSIITHPRAARHVHAVGHDLAVHRLVSRPPHRLRVRRERRGREDRPGDLRRRQRGRRVGRRVGRRDAHRLARLDRRVPDSALAAALQPRPHAHVRLHDRSRHLSVSTSA